MGDCHVERIVAAWSIKIVYLFNLLKVLEEFSSTKFKAINISFFSGESYQKIGNIYCKEYILIFHFSSISKVAIEDYSHMGNLI